MVSGALDEPLPAVRPDEPLPAVRPDEHDDPVAAVLAAHAAGAPLSLATSGTTGAGGRRVRRSTRSWWVTFDAYSDLSGIGPDSALWVPGPWTSTMVLFAQVHAAVVGARLAGSPVEATHACLTPAQLELRGDDLPAGTMVTVAGARLPARLVERATERLDLRHYYGAAELSFVAAGTTGSELRAFPGVQVDVRDGDDSETGTIWVRSPWVCEGYDGLPGSLRRDDSGWATVGDQGRLDGDLLTVVGRPDAVTTAGATVRFADVESVLAAVAHAPFAVHPVDRRTLGQVVAVTLTDPDDRGLLERYAREHLPASHRPRVWRVVAALPLNAAGKVDRARLAADSAEGATMTAAR